MAAMAAAAQGLAADGAAAALGPDGHWCGGLPLAAPDMQQRLQGAGLRVAWCRKGQGRACSHRWSHWAATGPLTPGP